ncbi:MAG: Peptide methionine sulfoxide reductase MsrA [Methylococcaceae bacterium NSP1-2]|nr:peptide-methionine (S)-S-oxide reductase MsrA [Methylococcaceae bacterium]OYV16341.1 MAG: Peptide methionine sulfoxide reductase MsrA [Methylococcaceae bacterium NSP1-2]
MIFSSKKLVLPDPASALVGRPTPMPISNRHFVTGQPIAPPFPAHLQQAFFALGCFWGAERKFWQYPHIVSTAVGYSGGYTPNPSYEEVCTGQTGHTEVVSVIYDPALTSYDELLQLFWESHNPTQGMQQGNDIGTASKEHYQQCLIQRGFKDITTEIKPVDVFYYAEDYHQQYLAKNPQGYCGLGGLGVRFNG